MRSEVSNRFLKLCQSFTNVSEGFVGVLSPFWKKVFREVRSLSQSEIFGNYAHRMVMRVLMKHRWCQSCNYGTDVAT